MGGGHFDPLRIFPDNSKTSSRSDSILGAFYRHSLRAQKFQTLVTSLLESLRVSVKFLTLKGLTFPAVPPPKLGPSWKKIVFRILVERAIKPVNFI